MFMITELHNVLLGDRVLSKAIVRQENWFGPVAGCEIIGEA